MLSKVIAFVCVAIALACCVWIAPWRGAAIHGQEGWTAVATAGGLFSIAIAVLIRD
jgi:hypothetical protein